MNEVRRDWIPSVVFAVACCFTSPVFAADWLPVTAAELQLTSEPKAPGAAATYLYRQVDRDDRTSTEYVYCRLKILREEGRKYADVEISYAKGSESIQSIEARTIRPDGSFVAFDRTVYDKPIVDGRGVRLMAKTFTMPEAGVGSIIEYRYRRVQNFNLVYDSRWIVSQELFTQHAKFSLIPSEYFPLRWTWSRGALDGTASPQKDRAGVVRLDTHDIPAFVAEELMPPANELKFRVDFIYLERDNVEKTPEAYWKRVNRDRFSEIEKFVRSKKAMERAVATIVQPEDSADTKLRKIYARVQRIHNVGYEPEKTDEELKREQRDAPHDVEDVWNHGSGTPTQINYLLVALARAAGLEANTALVATRDEYFFDKTLMNSRQLNSNFVIVTLAGKDCFLHPGVPFTPFGMLPWNETAVEALRLDSAGGKWVISPLPSAVDSRIERTAHLKMLPDGSLAGQMTLRCSGLEAAWRRVAERNEDEAERKRFLEDQLRYSVPSGIDVELTNTPDWSAADEPLVAQFDLKVPGWVQRAGERELLKIGLFGAADDRTFQHQARVHPIYFNFPYLYSDDIWIELPAGAHVNSLPKARNLDFKQYSYSLAADERDNTLHLRRDLTVSLLLVREQYYDQLRQFFQSVRTADEEQVVVSSAKSVAQR